MADVTAAVLETVQTAQLALNTVQTLLALTAFMYPPDCTLTNNSHYDFIIIGGGTAGSVLANRLSANPNYNILVIEAGGDPPLEATMMGAFSTLVTSPYDFNITSVNDGSTAQNIQKFGLPITVGKMLGGSSALNHGIHVSPSRHDFDVLWAEAIGDDSWSYDKILPYIQKSEKLVDTELLNSTLGARYGDSGYIKLTRELHPVNDEILAAFEEIGRKIVMDTTADDFIGYLQPLFSNYGNRQHGGNYFSDTIGRSNLCVAKFTTATKILTENGAAIGVEVITSGGDEYVLYADKEVVLSAGAIKSPQLLLLSGIGPKEHLESLEINVIADLPVGKNFMDHPSAIMVYQMEENTNGAPPLNPYLFPSPCTVGYGAIDPSQTYPDYQAILVRLPSNSTAAVQMCSQAFKYNNEICNTFYEASINRTVIYVIFNLMLPKSRGQVMLNSVNPFDDPLVYTGTYTDISDLELMVESMEDFNKILESTYFKDANSRMEDLGIKNFQDYATSMSAGMWHYMGTCAIGSVVDTSLLVKGLENLRVVDASVIPAPVTGNMQSVVYGIAERASEMILTQWEITST